MIDVSYFIENMLLDFDVNVVANSIAHEHNLLRKLYGGVESKTITAGEPIVVVEVDVADILMVSFNHKILHRVGEDILDSINPSWRVLTDLLPTSYLYRGEEKLQQLRLYPIPTVDGTLQIIKFREPNASIARWHDIYIALASLGTISTVDTLRNRAQMEKVTDELKKIVVSPISDPIARRNR